MQVKRSENAMSQLVDENKISIEEKLSSPLQEGRPRRQVNSFLIKNPPHLKIRELLNQPSISGTQSLTPQN